jgi:TonB-linked SusC/RagA family outer membrane protein
MPISLLRTKASMLGLAVFAALVVTPRDALGQSSGTLSGRVTEAHSQRPVSDVQVTVVGAERSGVTNSNGEYTIVGVPAGAQRVRARRIGFAPSEQATNIEAGAVTSASFTLNPTATDLGAVVVTGTAGSQERRTLGNSITQLNVAEINDRSTLLTVTDALQSKTPGVTILPGSGIPGASADIRIRGASSLNGYRPVVFIDGIRYNIEGLGNFNATGSGLVGQAQSSQATSALDLISPNDIESIEVLKGPAAATLYGADAAAGVIQIITKKGTRGQQNLRWTGKIERGTNKWGTETPTTYTVCDAVKIADTAVWPGCTGQPLGTLLTQNILADRSNNALRDGTLDRLSTSVRGGGDRYSFYISGDRDRDYGVFYNSFLTRQSMRSNFSFTPTEKIDFNINVGYVQTQLGLPYQDESANSLLLSAARGRPGRVTTNGMGWSTVNPSQSNQYDNTTKSDRTIIGGTLNYNPFSWFKNRFTAGIDYTTSLAQLLAIPGQPDDPAGSIAQRTPRNRVYTLDYVASLIGSLPRDLVSTTSIGSQVIASRAERLDATGVGLGAPDVTLIGTAATLSGANSFSENNSVGYYIQEQMGWKNRLFVTGALRADDNSSFGTNFNAIIYPKASLSWVLSEEPFAQRFLNALRAEDFKFRTAWGRAGRAPAPYSATQTYTVDRVATGSGTVLALRTSSYGNPDLKPERGEEIEVGFESAFFSRRTGVDFTYYSKRTMNMLQSVPISPSLGFPASRLGNIGEVTNKGIELGLNVTPVQRPNFTWDMRLNLSTNANKLITFGDPANPTKFQETPASQAYGAVQRHRVGYPLGGYWVQFALRNPDGSPQLSSTGTVLLDTAQYIGPSAPTREYGLSQTISFFKNFRLYALVDWKRGQYLFNLKESNRCTAAANLNCERVNRPNLLFPVTREDTIAARELPVWRQVVSTYVEPADFTKLRDLSLSYTLPQGFLKSIGAETAQITLAGHNLKLWTKYTGLDPEVNTYGGRNFIRVDSYAAPMTRRVSVSLTLSY